MNERTKIPADMGCNQGVRNTTVLHVQSKREKGQTGEKKTPRKVHKERWKFGDDKLTWQRVLNDILTRLVV
jgi:hypothetical protein